MPILQPLVDNNNHRSIVKPEQSANDMLQEIQCIIRAEEIKNKHRAIASQNGSTPEAIALQNRIISKEQSQIADQFKRGNHQPHRALVEDDHNFYGKKGASKPRESNLALKDGSVNATTFTRKNQRIISPRQQSGSGLHN